MSDPAMNTTPESSLSAERFAEIKFDLPEGGRWSELCAGQVVHFQPPEEMHGTVVLNLSKRLGEHLEQWETGAVCFELGLIVKRDPDTVYCPAMSFFRDAERFALADEIVTDRCPDWIAEIVSTNDRRRQIAERVDTYLRWGVSLVWIVDPHERLVHTLRPHHPRRRFLTGETLHGQGVLPGFRMSVDELFAEPAWWRGT